MLSFGNNRRKSPPKQINRPFLSYIFRGRRKHLDRSPIRPHEIPLPFPMPPNREAAFMHKRVMCRAEHEQVLEFRLAAVAPMLHVMCIEIARVMTSRERARSIAREHGFLQRARDDALLSSNV